MQLICKFPNISYKYLLVKKTDNVEESEEVQRALFYMLFNLNGLSR